MDNKAVFAERLKSLIQQKHFTQERLASSIGVKYQAIGAYLRGTSTPTFDTLVKISSTLEVSTDYLLGLSDIPSLSVDIQNAATLTGLSDNAINALGLMKRFEKGRKIRFYLDKLLSDLCYQYQDIHKDAERFEGEELASLYENMEMESVWRESPLSCLYDYDRACHAHVIATGTTPRFIPEELRESLKDIPEAITELEHRHEGHIGILVDGEDGGQLRVKELYKTHIGQELLKSIEAFGGADNGKY